MTAHVLPATVADADAIVALEAVSAAEPWSLPSISAQLSQPHSRAWITTVDGEPTAYLLATAIAGEGEVLTIGTAPPWRRRGLAAALLTRCADTWRAEGVDAAFLEVRSDNLPAIHLYTRLGWAVCGRRPRYYRDGTDAVLMRWSP